MTTPVSWWKLFRIEYFSMLISARAWFNEYIQIMSNSYSFYWVKVILVVTVLHNGSWINPSIKSSEGRIDFIWISILKVIKTKSAAPERVFSLQNLIVNHHFQLILFELRNLCFCKYKFFQFFVCWVMLTKLFHHFSFSPQGFEIFF